tara:strand:+ start:150 stop:416 length:267 start_codon:yes stop_codon:yes gene_type:complete
MDIFNLNALLIFIGAGGSIFYYHNKAYIDFRSQRKTKNRFKKIMDNSEEGIIIIKDKTIDYINDKFFEQQQRLIQEVLLPQNNQRVLT